jgi:hypothetical protein
MKAMVIVSATALIAFGLFWTGEQERLRRVTAQKETQAETSNQRLPKTITVKAGESLQRAIDRARYGDEIVVEAGAVFQGPIILRNKGPLPSGMTDEQAYITIRSSRAGELPSGAAPYTSSEILAATNPTTGLWNLDQFPRHQFGWQSYVKPEHAPLMPKIVAAPADQGALQTEAGAHHYKLVGLEFRPTDENQFVYDLVKLGRGGFADGQNTLAEVPHHFIIDRCYIHAYPNQDLKRGVALNSSDTQIINSYISGFKSAGFDSQAVGGWNGTGNYIVENCYLEGAGENFLTGGADTAIQNNVMPNLVFRRNYVRKPVEWYGSQWSVKNLFELKIGKNVLVEGNVFENNWAAAQSGDAIVLKVQNQDGRAPWTTLEDVVFRHNIVRKVAGAINLLGLDYLSNFNAQQAKRITIHNNLLVVDGPWPNGRGTGIMVNPYVLDLVVSHNTILCGGTVLQLEEGSSSQIAQSPGKNARLKFLNNIGTGRGVSSGPYAGWQALDWSATEWQYQGNVYVDYYGPSNTLPPDRPVYPVGNYQVLPSVGISYIGFTDTKADNYRLRPNSPYKKKALDGRDIGCDIDLIEEAIGKRNY